jgi:hypothetical protein
VILPHERVILPPIGQEPPIPKSALQRPKQVSATVPETVVQHDRFCLNPTFPGFPGL